MAQILTIIANNWLTISLFFFLIGQFISSLELYNNRTLFYTNGLLDLKIVKLYYPNRLFPSKSLLTFLLISRIIITLILFVLLICSQQTDLFFNLILILILTIDLYINITMPVGKDGSDQMMNIYLTTMVIYLFIAKTSYAIVPLIFITAQLCLSYVAAGISKLVSSTWRNKEILSAIFSTETYGSQNVSKFLKNNVHISLFASWSIMLWEAFFPIFPFFGSTALILSLLIGIMFHLLNYFIMGLNKFFWIFLACYPIYIYVLKVYHIL